MPISIPTKWIDLCSDFRTSAQILEIYKKVSSFDPSTEMGIRMRFLTDINAENILFCKELMKVNWRSPPLNWN